MKAIHGGKTKNGRIDSYKIASLLRGGKPPPCLRIPWSHNSTPSLRRRLSLDRCLVQAVPAPIEKRSREEHRSGSRS